MFLLPRVILPFLMEHQGNIDQALARAQVEKQK